MSHISKSTITTNYSPIEHVLVYRGECSVCRKPKSRNIYSLHQAITNIYNEQIHGPIEIAGEMQGIYKDVQVNMDPSDDDEVLRVFHQVAKASDGQYHVYTPMHAACDPCIQKILSSTPARCHICREDLPAPRSSHKKKSHPLSSLPRDDSGLSATPSPVFPRSYLDEQIMHARFSTFSRIDPDDFFFRTMPRATRQHLSRGAFFTRSAENLTRTIEEDASKDLALETMQSGHTLQEPLPPPPPLYSDIPFDVTDRRKVNFRGMDQETIAAIKSLIQERGLSSTDFFQEQCSVLREARIPPSSDEA